MTTIQSELDEAAPERLSDSAYQCLEEKIVTLELPPGRAVTESQLSKWYGFGRSPIRSAVQRLAAEGLVAVYPRRGIFISDIDVRSQIKMLQVRREVERLVVCLATVKSTPEQKGELAGFARELEQIADSNDGNAYLQLDLVIQDKLLTASRNEWAETVLHLMQPLSRRFWYLNYKKYSDLPKVARLYADVLHAVVDGDSERVKTASDERFDYFEYFARETIID